MFDVALVELNSKLTLVLPFQHSNPSPNPLVLQFDFPSSTRSPMDHPLFFLHIPPHPH